MAFCTNCGTPVGPGQVFCGTCGTRLAVTPAPPATPPPAPTATPPVAQPATPPPAPTADQPGAPPSAWDAPPGSAPTADFSWLVGRNWPAIVATAVVAVTIAVAVSMSLILASDPPGASTSENVAFGMIGAAASVSTDAVLSVAGTGDTEDRKATAAVGVVPLFVSLLSLGAAVWVFRRLTRSEQRLGPVVGDAAFTALLFAAAMLVVAIAGRRDRGVLLEAFDISDDDVSELSWGPSVPTAPLLAVLVMLGLLVASAAMQGDRLPDTARRAHAVLAPALMGLTAFVLLLPIAGGISYVATALTGDSFSDAKDGLDNEGGDTGDFVAILVGGVANAGTLFLHIGAGGRVGERHDASDFDEETGSEWHRLGWFADHEDTWGYWLAIPTLVLVLLACAWLVQRRARATGAVLPALGAWAALMFVAFPLLARLASIHVDADASDAECGDNLGMSCTREDLHAAAFVGARGVDSLLVPLAALGVAIVVAALYSRRRQSTAPQQWGTSPLPRAPAGWHSPPPPPPQKWGAPPPPPGSPSPGPPPPGWPPPSPPPPEH